MACIECTFCNMTLGSDDTKFNFENKYGFVIRDNSPVSSGHSLIILKRHVLSFFELSPAERTSLFFLVEQIKSELDDTLKPDGYNIGINDGAVAGQTIPHLHIHLIPRYSGDMLDPSGGVRGVIPGKQKY